ncbi:MAG: prenyltransferase/squalene oxidase repeat-containing protein [Promethearchaeota archaeon]
MTWIPILLADRSIILRYLVLINLLHKEESNVEVQELENLRFDDPLIKDLIKFQNPDGSWGTSNTLGLHLQGALRNTAHALIRLGYLGFDKSYPPIQKAAEFLFTHQLDNGAWPIKNGKPTFKHPNHGEVISPLITTIPLRALAMCGFAEDKRSEKAYDYLLSIRTEDGSWPTYLSPDGKVGYQVVGYRQLPNSRLGCRSNTTGALTAFAYHPKRRNDPEIKRVLDLLLARETKDRQSLGFEVARYVGIEPARGYLTYFARFDLAHIINLSWRIGASLEDPRILSIVKYLEDSKGSYGLWDYQPKPEATRWVTYDILHSLSHLDEEGDWMSIEPRTKYKSYPRKPRRY